MPKNTLPLTVSIVNYHSAHLLPDCLDSLEKFLPVRYEVIVIQHSDEPLEISTRAPLRIIKQKNLGFGAGHNRSAKEARGELILFFNPDARLVEPLDAFLALMRNATIGICAPRLETADGQTQRYATGNDISLRALLSERLLRPCRNDCAKSPYAVDWVSGAAMLTRRNDFVSLGGFDENFFLYFEDADLCRRMRLSGKKVVFDPTTTVRHIGGQSFPDRRTQKNHYDQSQDYYFRKYNSLPIVWTARILRKIYRFLNK